MPKSALWTPAEDAELMAMYLTKSNADLAVQLDRSEKAIKQRASQLGITTQVIDDADAGANAAVKSNQDFIDAMIVAIRAGLERPPMMGVDKRSCTRRPIFIPHGGVAAPSRTASQWANG